MKKFFALLLALTMLLTLVACASKPAETEKPAETTTTETAAQTETKTETSAAEPEKAESKDYKVEQNLETGTINWHGFFGRKPYDKDLEEVYDLFPRLRERKDQYAWSLSGGEQQMLAVGRAMMARPTVLMLDEPSMGLAPILVAEVFEKIIQINREQGMTILLVEQNARSAMKISDRCYVMDNGKILMSGNAKEMISDPKIIQAYFGGFAKNVKK